MPLYILQAYAELEKDTPGQIFGVTHKTDGKSSTSNSSSTSWTRSASTSSSSTSSSSSAPPIDERFTQKANDERAYEATDERGTHEYARERNAERHFFMVGAGVVIGLALIWFMQNQTEAYVDFERDRTFREQAERRAAEQEEQQQQQQLNRGIFPPDNQPRSV